MTPAVITSRAAKKDFETIKVKHAELLSNLTAHQEKVKVYNEQKKQEAEVARQQAEQQKLEQQKLAQERMQADQQRALEEKKLTQEAAHKDKEYEMKLLDSLK